MVVLHEHEVRGAWPSPDAAARARLTDVLVGLPDGAVVLLDGLIASSVPDVLLPAANRLRLVVLVHMPLDDAREGAVLSGATAIITTSEWTRRRVIDRYALEPDAVHVAEPGVDAADIAPGTAAGGELLCVAAVTPLKGHDVLLSALAMINGTGWHCMCVGTLTRDRDFVAGLHRRMRADATADRIRFTGPLAGADLHAAYAAADVLVLASRTDAYAMVVAEALARGLPVIATEVGGLPDTLGYGSDGSRPGLLVPAGEPAALAAALSSWLGDADLRRGLRQVARERRAALAGWPQTTDRIARVLIALAS